MSSPASPLASDLPAVAGGAVVPVERERHWWSPIDDALDRWLEPRWRALLTWVGVAAASCAALELGAGAALWSGSRLVFEKWAPYLPGGFPWWRITQTGAFATLLLLLYWIAPVALRLGLIRIVLWLTASVATVIIAAELLVGSLDTFVFFSYALGLPGLVVIGRRTRPWLSLVGGAALAVAVHVTEPLDFYSPPLVFGAATLIYAPLMLYGTSPLPRKEGGQ